MFPLPLGGTDGIGFKHFNHPVRAVLSCHRPLDHTSYSITPKVTLVWCALCSQLTPAQALAVLPSQPRHSMLWYPPGLCLTCQGVSGVACPGILLAYTCCNSSHHNKVALVYPVLEYPWPMATPALLACQSCQAHIVYTGNASQDYSFKTWRGSCTT